MGATIFCFSRALRLFLVGAILWACAIGGAQAGEFGPLEGWTFGTGKGPTVVVVHEGHGPKPFLGWSERLAKQFPSATVIAILRPGFRMGGKQSPGNRTFRDHLTRENNAMLAEALKAAKARHGNRRLIAVGQYDGALQVGTIIGTFPGIVDHAILVSCPCDLPRWRIQRKKINNWTSSQSPHDYVRQIPSSTRIHMIGGARDGFIPVTHVRRHAKLLKKAGKNVKLTVVPRVGFKLAQLEPTINAAIAEAMR
ncbi:MAG: hypothetical protein AAF631_13655 [Pseudomonadota bacterium]